MVKLGSLYRGGNQRYPNETTTLDRLEFNQRIQERRYLQEEQRQWDRMSPNQHELQVRNRTLSDFRVLFNLLPKFKETKWHDKHKNSTSSNSCHHSPQYMLLLIKNTLTTSARLIFYFKNNLKSSITSILFSSISVKSPTALPARSINARGVGNITNTST